MAEWTMAAVLKTAGGESLPWVRILLPPPNRTILHDKCKIVFIYGVFGGSNLRKFFLRLVSVFDDDAEHFTQFYIEFLVFNDEVRTYANEDGSLGLQSPVAK